LPNLADTLLKLGDIGSATDFAAQSIALAQSTGDRRNLGFALFTKATILQTQDKLGEALKVAEEDFALRVKLEDKANLPDSRRLLAEIALEQGKMAEAETLASSAAADFDQQGLSDLGASAYARLSQALLRQGKPEPAQAAAARAQLFPKRVEILPPDSMPPWPMRLLPFRMAESPRRKESLNRPAPPFARAPGPRLPASCPVVLAASTAGWTSPPFPPSPPAPGWKSSSMCRPSATRL
jgi:tetratricopeptide (TPR) repeat protein